MRIIYLRICALPKINYYLRTVPPSSTFEATRRIDDRLLTACLNILNLQERYLSTSHGSNERLVITELFHQKIRMGGLGFSNSTSIAPTAYLGSAALTFSHFSRLGAVTDTYNPETNPIPEIPMFSELINIIASLKNEPGNDVILREIDIYSILKVSTPGLQTLLNLSSSERRAAKIIELGPQRSRATSVGIAKGVNFETKKDAETRTQRLGQSTKAAGAVLSMMPKHASGAVGSIPDRQFREVWGLIAGIPASAHKELYCPCGEKEPLERSLGHCLSCRIPATRGVLRGNNHRIVQDATSLILQDAYSTFYRVSNNPVVEDHFERTIAPRPSSIPSPPSAAEAEEQVDNTNFKAHKFKQGIGKDARFRADILLTPTLSEALKGAKEILYDCTEVHPTSGYALKNYEKGGDAAEAAEKRKYDLYGKQFIFDKDQLTIIAWETNGALSVATQQLLRSAATYKSNSLGVDYARTLQCYFQQLSHAIHLGRANATLSAVEKVVLRPEQRLDPNGPNFKALTNKSTFKQVQAQRK